MWVTDWNSIYFSSKKMQKYSNLIIETADTTDSMSFYSLVGFFTCMSHTYTHLSIYSLQYSCTAFLQPSLGPPLRQTQPRAGTTVSPLLFWLLLRIISTAPADEPCHQLHPAEIRACGNFKAVIKFSPNTFTSYLKALPFQRLKVLQLHD